MKNKRLPVVRTDGKRSVRVEDERNGGVEISLCRNGRQTTSITIDPEMAGWLATALGEYLAQPARKAP